MAFGSVGAEATDIEGKCHKLYRLTDVSHAIEPGIPVAASDGLPAHCRVRGVVNRAIRFEVRLPMADWNGRLMFTAVGGAAGVIGDTTSLLADGFAMASTDTGHELSEGFEFYKQPEALLDYAYRGVHLATLASKRVISGFYGRDVDHAYLTGCSNGGRGGVDGGDPLSGRLRRHHRRCAGLSVPGVRLLDDRHAPPAKRPTR